MLVAIDIETFSCVDLKKSNVYAYSEDPTFEVLMLAYSENGGPVSVLVGEPRIRERFQQWLDADATFIAHGANFERVCMSRLLGLPTGSYLMPDDWVDTAALAAENGLPRDLKRLAKALGAPEKDEAGTRLINLFSKPYRRKRVSPDDKPEDWLAFRDYCVQDVETLVEVYRLLTGGWPTDLESRLWVIDARINDRGITCDLDLAAAAIDSGDRLRASLMAEAKQITGLDNPNSTQQLHGWLAEMGCPLDDLQAETVKTTLKFGDVDPLVRRVLEIRQETSLAALKKYDAALRGTSEDGRLRGQFRFFGAHTGRWAGSGVQLQNLPRASVENPQAEIDKVLAGEVVSSQTLKALVRPLLTGPFTVVDYSAIESRVLAWLAGEQWKLDAFAEGRDMYVEIAEKMNRGYTRQQGKTAELALGFGGGVGALRRMGAKDETDEELVEIRDLWRSVNPRITSFWRAVDLGFQQGGRAGRLNFVKDGKDVKMILPSGRALTYHDVWVRYDPIDGRTMSFADPKGFRTDTWFGGLVENCVQATAREILAAALVRLYGRGYDIVAHVHDEVIVEGEVDVEKMTAEMCELEPWMAGLPLAGEGEIKTRYSK